MLSQKEFINAVKLNNIEVAKPEILSNRTDLDYNLSLLAAVNHDDYFLFDLIIEHTNVYVNHANSFLIQRLIKDEKQDQLNKLLSIKNNEYFLNKSFIHNCILYAADYNLSLFANIVSEKRNNLLLIDILKIISSSNNKFNNIKLNQIIDPIFEQHITNFTNFDELIPLLIKYDLLFYFKKIINLHKIPIDLKRQGESSLIVLITRCDSVNILDYLFSKQYTSIETVDYIFEHMIYFSSTKIINYMINLPQYQLLINKSNNKLFIFVCNNINKLNFEEIYLKMIVNPTINPLDGKCLALGELIDNERLDLLPHLLKHPYVSLFSHNDIANRLTIKQREVFLPFTNINGF